MKILIHLLLIALMFHAHLTATLSNYADMLLGTANAVGDVCEEIDRLPSITT